jgi:hypothetical protein
LDANMCKKWVKLSRLVTAYAYLQYCRECMTLKDAEGEKIGTGPLRTSAEIIWLCDIDISDVASHGALVFILLFHPTETYDGTYHPERSHIDGRGATCGCNGKCAATYLSGICGQADKQR